MSSHRSIGGLSAAMGGILRLSATEVLDPELGYPIKPYNVSKKQYRGLCLVINQRNFERSTGQSQRDGTDVDADRVHRVFRALGYCVSCYLNVNRERFGQLLKEMATTDHSHFDSFVCVILSHGANGVIFATDGPIPVETIVGHFRGGDVVVTKLPVEADILVAHSTVPGYFAWRNSTSGSWFIQELCRALESDLEAKQPHDILQLLTVVARCVAYQYRSNTGVPDSHDKTQMTSVTTTLTRMVYLTKRQ
ncbi:unnamed protein product [Echinostoma caproni]|uniref:Caspase 3 n=1 Tax=Echinostoma caproni TaxID=27848 RepID=A0A183AMA6_9TREM|nr:unnamed protein product [Echinostoma caproni]